MLSDEKKKEIQEKAEIKRYKRSLKEKKGFLLNLWSFVNSSFGLWIISAVFVSGISTYITKLNLRLQEEKIEKKKNYRLLSEFGARFSRLDYLTNDGGVTNRLQHNTDDFTNLLFQSTNEHNTSIIYPEFNNHTLMSISFQLEQAIQIDTLKNSIRGFRHSLYKLEQGYSITNIRDSIDGNLTIEDFGQELTKFRIDYGNLLHELGFFGDLSTYFGYKPDFDEERFEELFGYKKDFSFWILVLFIGSILFGLTYFLHLQIKRKS